jgi:type II secretory pathway pseudopilin PulG
MKLFPKFTRLQSGRGAQSAFTMIEIALSLAVIGFALVAIIGVLPIGMSVQKDNREETIISFDATYLMDTLRNGARGQDNLTNFILSITNYTYKFDANSNYVAGSAVTAFYTPTKFSLDSVTVNNAPFLTNGANIAGLLLTPRFEPLSATDNSFRSNYTTADFRAFSSSAVDQGTNQASKDFAFSYRLNPQFITFSEYDSSWTNFATAGLLPQEVVAHSNYLMSVKTLRLNCNEIRLRFEWPILQGGVTGNGRQVFRTTAGGATIITNGSGQIPTLRFIQPQIYVAPAS